MYAKYAIPILGAALVYAQGEGEGYPPPPPQTLETTKSGVLPVLPTSSAAFTGVIVNEGAIVNHAPPNPTYTPLSGPATTATGLPAATYQATLPSTNFNDGLGSTTTGDVQISSDGTNPGVSITVNFHGLPDVAAYGPFVYHIHTLPVPSDGNCSATMGHLDPTNAGEYYTCNPATPQLCQVGDLSGKNGMIMASGDFSAQLTDAFLSTDPSSAAFFGDKSIVIHTNNATRITCANFVQSNGGGAGGSNGTIGGASGTGVGPANPTNSLPVQQTGGAEAVSFGAMAVAAGLLAAVL